MKIHTKSSTLYEFKKERKTDLLFVVFHYSNAAVGK